MSIRVIRNSFRACCRSFQTIPTKLNLISRKSEQVIKMFARGFEQKASSNIPRFFAAGFVGCAASLFVFNTLYAQEKTEIALVEKKFEEEITKFLADHRFPGAVVSIYQNDKMILNKAYGNGVEVNRIYPIASLSKHFTFKAIEKLIQENLISKEDKVWEYLNLTKTPKDPRVQDITIGQLLEHRGGWNAEISGDPLFSSANQPILIEEFMSSKMLDFSPGAQECYSNFGYLVLGAVIEKATGMNYLDHINQRFADPIGVKIYQAETPTKFTRDAPGAGTFQLESSTASFGLAARTQDVAHNHCFPISI